MAKKLKEILVPGEIVVSKILLIRGKKVMLDRDLAELYGATTFHLNEQVKKIRRDFISRWPHGQCVEVT
ncbi:MAG: ORF6N domain-containing protein [Niabella sp.]